MKRLLSILLSTVVLLSAAAQDHQHFYGICWRGNPHQNLAYAKQMRYGYVFYQRGMELDTLSDGLFFYLETPEYLTYNRTIDTQKKYPDAAKQFYETFCTLKDTAAPFPSNLATGWFFNATSFTPLLDMQQQRVIDYAIDSILKFAGLIEQRNPKFHFGGLAWDVPQPSGDFWDTVPKRKQVTLSHFTGADAGAKPLGAVHDFPSYTEGHIAFYKQLYAAVRSRYPHARFMMEPYNIYRDWIALVKNRPDAKEIMPDLLSQEGPGTAFATDSLIFASHLINKNRVCSTTPNTFGEAENRLVAATAAINGAWFNWYGRFGGTGDMPDYKNITEVPDRLKLVRLLANYENLNHTPLPNRKWDGSTYASETAFANAHAIAILQPATHKYFVVFMDKDGSVPLPNNKRILSIFTTNDLLMETENGSKDLTVVGNQLKPNENTRLGKAYIVRFDR